MKRLKFTVLLYFIIFPLIIAQNKGPIDLQASHMTKELFYNLRYLSGKYILFGHQNATSYGHSWKNEEDRSDVKDIVGAHPAVIGSDFGGLTSSNEETVENAKSNLKKILQDTYKWGGLVTICWHLNNPVNNNTFYYDKNPIPAVPHILPGGNCHDKYKLYLDRIAEVALSAKNEKGEYIPFVFRPFHELDGDWFWWGKKHCTRNEFIQLWRFTVDYLRYTKDVHSILYAFSPDCRFTTEEEYLERYPGDEYVDMFGMDNYWDFRPDGANNPELAKKKLIIISRLAEKKGKLAAFTETGLEGVKQVDWYTNVLLPILKDEQVKIAYVLVWRNAYDIEHHYYTPFLGHPAVDDFKKFYQDNVTWFEDDLRSFNLYQKK